MNQYLAMPQVRSKFPREFKAFWSVKPIDAKAACCSSLPSKMPNRDFQAPFRRFAVVDA